MLVESKNCAFFDLKNFCSPKKFEMCFFSLKMLVESKNCAFFDLKNFCSPKKFHQLPIACDVHPHKVYMLIFVKVVFQVVAVLYIVVFQVFNVQQVYRVVNKPQAQEIHQMVVCVFGKSG
eukprot:TRINITY_DN6323_c1_g1_i3.p2 TRINITY_DN6323_c1_g1~~TRINITY_DN6323_c1_g1_i3.p2  ORF type:complete len:120 (-),score=12.66 TRINITY_DN6323_c1_g1_i3:455-814(-)